MAKSSRNLLSTIKDYRSRLTGFIRKRVASNEDAEDILQDVWYQLSRVVDLDEIENISGWLVQVARNNITDRYRKEKNLLLDDMVFEDEEGSVSLKDILSGYGGPEDEFFKEIFWEELLRALDELPEAQRNAFIWNELEDMTLREISEKTGESIKTIISRKGYAVKHLRNRLQTLYDELNNY